ncbi:hypothetical protein D3C81_1766660 [compost metagenome]
MVSNSAEALTTIFEPALRGVEPRSSMMVTSTQGSPRDWWSARALIHWCMIQPLLKADIVLVGAGLPRECGSGHTIVFAGQARSHRVTRCQ